MESSSIAAGIENLCLGDDLAEVVASRLGAVPKTPLKKAIAASGEPKVLYPPPVPPLPIKGPSLPKAEVKNGPSLPKPQAKNGNVPTPAMAKKQRRRNRKDKRKNDDGSEVKAVEGQGVERSQSEISLDDMSRLPESAINGFHKEVFKSHSSVNIATGVKNLPDSFFSDELPEEIKEREEKEKAEAKGGKGKRKRLGKRAKQASAEEEDKKSSDKENEKVEDIEDTVEVDDEDPEPVEGLEGDEGTVYNWRNVTKNGSIKKCILVDGSKEDEDGRPKAGDVVLVKSQGKLKDGTMIDDYPTLVFRVGEYEVIEGLDLVVQSMYKNELAIVSIKPDMAYGELGRKPDIPADARITYLFGLLHFEKQKDMSEMTWAQRRKMGQSRMRIANWWYSRKEYPIAVKCYKKALQFYNNIPTNQECSTPEEYKELLTLMEERLRVMRQVANIFKRIANLIQSGTIET